MGKQPILMRSVALGDALNPKSFRQTNMVLSSHLEGQARLRLVINTIPWLFSFPTRFFFFSFPRTAVPFCNDVLRRLGTVLHRFALNVLRKQLNRGAVKEEGTDALGK